MKNLYIKTAALLIVIVNCMILSSCAVVSEAEAESIPVSTAESTCQDTTQATSTSRSATEKNTSKKTAKKKSKVKINKKKTKKKVKKSRKKVKVKKKAKVKKTVNKKRKKRPLMIGHRGYSAKYPESTLEAFNGAFKRGFDGIECDVWETDSDDLLVQHDPTTTRTTGKKQYIWCLSNKLRYQYPIINGEFVKNYKNKKLIIPTLEEVLKVVKKNKGWLYLHIKNNRKYYLTDNGVKTIIRLLKKYKLTRRTLIFGGMEYVKPFINKGFTIGLFAAPSNKEQIISMARWCKRNKVKTLLFANMKRLKLYGSGKKLAGLLKRNNLDFGVYKTLTRRGYRYLRRLGARFSMSDKFIR